MTDREVILEIWDGAGWSRAGSVAEQEPPGSITSDWPSRNVYLFGWASWDDDPAPGVWASQGGLDSETAAVRMVTSAGFDRLADLTEGPYELRIVRDRHRLVRFRLAE